MSVVSVVQLAFTSISRISLDTERKWGGDVPLHDVLVHATIEVDSRGCSKSGVYPFGTSPVHANIHMDLNVSLSPLVSEPNVVIHGKCFPSFVEKEGN